MGALRSAIEEAVSTDLSWLSDSELTEEATELARSLDLLTHRLASVAAEVARRGCHRAFGFLNVTSWLARIADVEHSTARRLLGYGRALSEHPATDRLAASGEISEARLRILSAAARSHPDQYRDHEEMLLEFATSMKLRDFKRAIAYWSNCADSAKAEEEARHQRQSSYLHASVTHGGMVKLDGLLDQEVGEVVMAAFDAAMTPEARRKGGSGDLRPASRRRVDALHHICSQYLANYPGTIGGQRPHASLIVDLETLLGRTGKRCDLSRTGTITPETARRILCDAAVSRVIVRGDSEPLDLGRETRTATPAQRRALAIRDGGCAWDGCDRPPEWCDVHHRTHWIHGGETNLEDLELFCRPHHIMTHELDGRPPP